jgi:LAO/AO transport system kinase
VRGRADDRVARTVAGDLVAAAALMRAIDDDLPGARDALRAIYEHGGRAFVVGITGAPGVGKSTLVDALVMAGRARGERVAVVAVDPSSPFSGGALLGDRVRMQRHALDDGVFIRSLATRGQTGGLSRSTTATAAVLDAAGFPLIFIETVGAGQAEIDVADAADAVLVVTAPGLGDDVQALKAGLLEIADVLIVNKGDRDGADRAMADLTTMLGLAAFPSRPGEPIPWGPSEGPHAPPRRTALGEAQLRPREQRTAPPLVRASAATGVGVADIVAALDELRAAPAAERDARRRRQAVRQITAIVGENARAAARAAIGTEDAPGPLAATVDQVAARKLDPWSAAEALTTGKT